MRKSDIIGSVQREFGQIDIYEIYPENNSKETWNREKSQRKTIGFSESESEDRELERKSKMNMQIVTLEEKGMDMGGEHSLLSQVPVAILRE